MLFRHQQWEDGIEHPSSEDLAFYCRVCGPNRFFESDSHLQNHIEAMHDRLVGQLRWVILIQDIAYKMGPITRDNSFC